ncbi:hypothetical protein [Hymenobacter edaphi]|nr:hypothetical protein [Hymenobacter edaphi]
MPRFLSRAFLLAGLPLLTACETLTCSDDPVEDAPGRASVFGRWELESSTGGMLPASAPTIREVIEFAPDSTVRIYRGEQLTQQYRLRPASGDFCTQLRPLRLLRLQAATPAEYSPTFAYQLQGPYLLLDGNMCLDGTLSRYRWLEAAQ